MIAVPSASTLLILLLLLLLLLSIIGSEPDNFDESHQLLSVTYIKLAGETGVSDKPRPVATMFICND